MNPQKVLVFKTNLSTVSRYLVIKWMLDRNADVIKWSLDQSDCDNVLRIIGSSALKEVAVKAQLNSIGYRCERLK